MRIGLIGTSQIAEKSMQAAIETEFFSLAVVYSRQEATAVSFCKKFNIDQYETDLMKFFERADCDIVYIASPNTFHFEQAKMALQHHKHVFVEKPAVVTQQQWSDLQQIAKENDVYLFEAIRHAYEPNFLTLKNYLKSKKISGANMLFGQYSSRMADLKNGVIQNIFKPEMSAGALMDLGVYPLHSAISWFGEPEQAYYFPIKYKNGIDLQGDVQLNYANFNVHIYISKCSTTIGESEIYLDNATLGINSIDHIKQINVYNTQDKTPLHIETPENRMFTQWKLLERFFNNDVEAREIVFDIQKTSELVVKWLEKLRIQSDIRFEADKESKKHDIK